MLFVEHNIPPKTEFCKQLDTGAYIVHVMLSNNLMGICPLGQDRVNMH